MISNLSHFVGEREDNEILYDTPFGYMFEYLCGCGHHQLARGPQTIHYLQELGKVMADTATTSDSQPELDSSIDSVHTYLGQFIDHDITARTDRETDFSKIIPPENIRPKKTDEVVQNLRNGRRPQLDLDSVFGEGPSFTSAYSAQADHLYNNSSLEMFINERSDFIDLRRDKINVGEPGEIKYDYRARIADARNDENLMVSQLHAAFIKTFNKISKALEPGLSNQETFCQSRRLVRWAYQYIVINDYLKAVCLPSVVSNILYNGPFFYNTSIPFMPIEFSVAGFRFGHSMIRPFYTIKDGATPKNIMKLLGPSMSELIDSAEEELKAENIIHWSQFVKMNGTEPINKARKIGPFVAKGLFDLSPVGATPPPSVLASLTQRNLLRGYLLSVPSGQSIAEAMRVEPMRHKELVDGLNEEQKCVMYDSGFTARTPLWYYILQEAKVQADGNSLGYVGSMLVAETLIGMVKGDFNSYLNNMDNAAVSSDGIDLPGPSGPTKIKSIRDLLAYAEVPI